MQGWISLHRQIKDHWIFEEKRVFSKFEAWIDLLMMTYYKDGKKIWKNKLIQVKRGQCIVTVRKLADRWDWSKQRVSNYINLLQEEGMIDTHRDATKTTITVVNYDVYQFDQRKTGHPVIKNGTENGQKRDANEDSLNHLYQGLEAIGGTGLGHKRDTSGTQTGHNINKENKENKKEDSKKKSASKNYADDSQEMILVKYFIQKMKERNPKIKDPNLQKWCNDIRLTISRDKRSIDDLKQVIGWACDHEFWHQNIMSPSSLRKQFDKLYTQMIVQQKKVILMPDKQKEPINSPYIGEWINSGRDPNDTEGLNAWINKGGNVRDLYRADRNSSRKSTDRFSAD